MQTFWESLTFDEYAAMSVADPVLHSRLPLEVAHRIEAMLNRWRDLEVRRLLRDMPLAPQRLSVVMPVRNRAHTLHRPILSLRQQFGCEIELVLVDDASTDRTVQRARELAVGLELNVITLPERRGQSAARNVGIEAARHPFVAFLDSDDWWDAAFGLIMTNALAANDALPVCTQRLLRPWPHRPAFRYGLVDPELLRNRNAVSVSSFVAPRALLLEVGGFPEDLTMYEDWVLAARLARNSYFHAVPAALSIYDTTTAQSVSKPEHEHEQADVASLRTARERVLVELDAMQRIPPSRSLGTRRRGEFRTEGTEPRAADARPCTIVVVSFEQPDVLEACLESLAPDAERPDVHLVIVDNASQDRRVRAILDSAAAHPRTRVMRMATNGGFSSAINRAHAETPSGHDLVMMNNDVVVRPGWLEGLRAAAKDPGVGLVVPSQVVPPDYEDSGKHVPSAEPDFEVDVTFSNHARNIIPEDLRGLDGVELRFVPLFCALVPAEVRPLGLPLRGGLHYESDRFLCDVVRLWGGYRIVRAARSRVTHLNDRSGRGQRDVNHTFFDRLIDGTLAERPSARFLQRIADSKATA